MKQSYGGFYISQIKQLQDRIFSKMLKENNLDLNGAQGRILCVLWQEDGLNMREIGKRTSLADTSLTGMIDRMLEKGIVVRKENPENRKVVLVYLTKLAQSLHAQYKSVSQEMSKIFYKNFSQQEIEQCELFLIKVLSNLKQQEELL